MWPCGEEGEGRRGAFQQDYESAEEENPVQSIVALVAAATVAGRFERDGAKQVAEWPRLKFIGLPVRPSLSGTTKWPRSFSLEVVRIRILGIHKFRT